MCEMMRDILETFGEYKVITANDGVQAVHLVVQESPDLVILDLRMPGISGLQVLERIKTHDEDIAVIMVTAVRELKPALDAVRLGAYDYIAKPMSIDALGLAVSRALERRRLLLENRAYQFDLEEKIAQQTEHLEQRIRELTALNALFQAHLNERYEVEAAYDQIAARVARLSEDLREVVNEVIAQGDRLAVSRLSSTADHDSSDSAP